jgi:Tfp pilus assembly ATPase PilU
MSDRRRELLVDLALMLGAFIAATLVAEAAGAANLGTAMTFGQIGVALAALYVVMRR